MKYFKTFDYIIFGMYIMLLIVALTQPNRAYVLFVVFAMLHFFPLNYLLRKHGYLSIMDQFGLDPTDKMKELVDDVIIAPFLRLIRFTHRCRVIPILFLSLLLFLLTYFVIPKVLQFPSLDLIYLQCK